jgi:hypothetical protein
VSFPHRFGSSVNRHTHDYCCIIGGLFEPLDSGQVGFLHAQALTSRHIAALAEWVRYQALRCFAGSGPRDADDDRDMLAWVMGAPTPIWLRANNCSPQESCRLPGLHRLAACG